MLRVQEKGIYSFYKILELKNEKNNILVSIWDLSS